MMIDRCNEIYEAGFTIVPKVLTAGEVSEYREHLDVLVSEQQNMGRLRNEIDSWMIHNPMFLDKSFYSVLENPVVVAMIDHLLSKTAIIYAFTTSSMPPGDTNYSRRIHVDCPRVIRSYITNLGLILALDDFTEENGPTEFLPASFEQVDEPSEKDFVAQAVRVFPKAGDLVCFNARTWHRGGINRTKQTRHALTINVCRSFMRQRFDYPRMTPSRDLPKLSVNQRRLLGFQVRMPTSLNEYYLPVDERLYFPNQG